MMAMMIRKMIRPVMVFSSVGKFWRQFEHSMRSSAFFATLTCFVFSGAALAAQPPKTHSNPVPPEPTVVHTGTNQATLPAVRVDAALKSYDHWLDQLAAENRTAGLATAVVSNDKVRDER